ncbi:hypothetical protein RhiirA4_472913 [Rhizophagus irregularis]|uniref:Uncharacterized protein n=1 Tax=Rhizophagus irregularis TaxID=588596 RepID=A0A2I1H5S7_9GLOM|nr:hypothetical protein RhiirA4_472913 [Rhizophagus irregularis]
MLQVYVNAESSKRKSNEFDENYPFLKRKKLTTTNIEISDIANFNDLANEIPEVKIKSKMIEVSNDIYKSYFDFGKAVFKRYKELKPEYDKDGSKAMVKKEKTNALMKLCKKKQRDPKRCISFLIA